MPKTHAERQRDYRQRQAQGTASLKAENTRLRGELGDVRAELADALAEADRLAGQACRHPSAAVLDGRCQACGSYYV
jgi:hypothetical protein